MMQLDQPIQKTITPGFTANDLPIINFSHIQNLTDETGMIQHALFDMPNRKEGYCIDDNSRALLLAVLASKSGHGKSIERLIPIYLSFIHYMQTENGEFQNFMSYSKVCLEDRGSEDSFGRTIMALGYLVNDAPSRSLITIASGIFNKAYP